MLYLLILVVALALLAMVQYNRLVRLRNNRENAFADIDVQLRQRHDRSPAGGQRKVYMTHERGCWRSQSAVGSHASRHHPRQDRAENRLGSALQGLKVAVGSLSDLKANTRFLSCNRGDR